MISKIRCGRKLAWFYNYEMRFYNEKNIDTDESNPSKVQGLHVWSDKRNKTMPDYRLQFVLIPYGQTPKGIRKKRGGRIMSYWTQESPKSILTSANEFQYYENQGRLRISTPKWENKQGELKHGKSVTLNINKLLDCDVLTLTDAKYIFLSIIDRINEVQLNRPDIGGEKDERHTD